MKFIRISTLSPSRRRHDVSNAFEIHHGKYQKTNVQPNKIKKKKIVENRLSFVRNHVSTRVSRTSIRRRNIGLFPSKIKTHRSIYKCQNSTTYPPHSQRFDSRIFPKKSPYNIRFPSEFREGRSICFARANIEIVTWPGACRGYNNRPYTICVWKKVKMAQEKEEWNKIKWKNIARGGFEVNRVRGGSRWVSRCCDRQPLELLSKQKTGFYSKHAIYFYKRQ